MPVSKTRCCRQGFLAAGALLFVFAIPLQAQDLSGNAMAFPRDVLSAYLAGDAETVWKHAGEGLRSMTESPQGLRQASAELRETMGPETAMLSEQLFDHPEGGGMKVYVRGVQHAEVPEMYWIVIFSPTEQKVAMIMPQPRQTIRSLFPEVTLP